MTKARQTYLNSSARQYLMITLIVIIGPLLLLPAFFFNATLEDSHIGFRYIRHMVDGYGFGIWNIGEPPVEGFSSTLWILLLSVGSYLGISVFNVSKLIGWISLISLPVVCMVAWYKTNYGARITDEPRNNWLLYAAIIYAIYLPFAWYSVSGMEAVFFAALVSVLLLSPKIFSTNAGVGLAASLASAALVLTRPEGILFGLVINSYFFYSMTRRQAYRSWPVAALSITIVVFLSVTLFRYIYFGDLVPNTYYAKANGGLRHAIFGIYYVFQFAAIISPFVLLGALSATMHWRDILRDSFVVFLSLFIALYCAYVIKVGGDPRAPFPMWRHFIHLAPVWVGLTAILIERLFRKFRVGLIAVVIASVVVDGLVLRYNFQTLVEQPLEDIRRYGVFKNDPPNEYFVWLSKFIGPQTLSAVSMAGQWPYYVPGRYLDILGLNNRYIAKHGKYAINGPTDSKSDMAYVMSKKPDVIDGYMSGSDLREGRCPPELHEHRSEMLNDMITNADFKQSYYFVLNAPYEHLDRALFVRREFFEKHESEGMIAVPVSEGPLYRHDCKE